MNTPRLAAACPKCGTPARVAVVLKARVRYQLNADGTIGRVLGTTHDAGDVVAYECGGGHQWPASAPPPEDS